MRKILSVILILALGWLAKLSYDMFQISQQLPVLQQNVLKLDQNNAKLNDQLVALQRQISTAPEQHSPSSAPVTNAAFTANPVVLIKQQLEFVEFALQQQQYTLAVEKLNEHFARNSRPTITERMKLADELDLTLKQVRNWFKTKRMRVIRKSERHPSLEEQQLLHRVSQGIGVDLSNPSNTSFCRKLFKSSKFSRLQQLQLLLVCNFQSFDITC